MPKRAILFAIPVIVLILFLVNKNHNDSTSKSIESPTRKEPEQTKKILRIGTIADQPLDEIRKFQPLIDYLNAHINSADYTFRATAASSLGHVIDFFNNGKIDILIDSPFPIYTVQEKANLNVILRRWKKGVKEYYSVVFVKKDSGINSVNDLEGRIIAFEDGFSTASYALPKASLHKQKLDLAYQKSPADLVPADKIGFVFSEDDENTIVWVLQGKVAAGAMNHIAFEKLAGTQISELKIIHKTITVPRHLVACRRDLDPSILQPLTNALLSMNDTDDGLRALASFGKTARFDLIPDGEKLQESVDKMIELLNENKQN